MLLIKFGSDALAGRYALALAIATPFFLFLGLQLRVLIITDAKREFQFGHYVRLRFLTSVIAISAIFALLLFTKHPTYTKLIIGLVALAKFAEAMSEIVYGLLLQKEKLAWMAISQILRGLFAVIIIGSVIFLSAELWLAISLMALSWWIVTIGLDFGTTAKRFENCVLPTPSSNTHNPDITPRSKVTSLWDLQVFWQIVQRGLPLGLALLFVSLNVQIPRYVIDAYLEESALGIFSALVAPVALGGLAINSILMTVASRLAQYYAKAQKTAFLFLISRLLLFSIIIGVLGLFIIYFIGKSILVILFRPDYADHWQLFIYLSVSGILGYINSIFGYAINACQYYKQQTIIHLAGVISSLLISFLLIPHYQLMGAALSLICTALVQMLFNAYFLLHAMRKGFGNPLPIST
jgi:O-antigen/teichoic acid export membrane protein